MSNQNNITETLELKDSNIIFEEIIHKVYEGYLTYNPDYCPKCGVVFDEKFEKHGFIISNNTKHKIACDLTKKRSEKDIAFDNNVSPNTVERVMDSYYESQKIHKHYLPPILSFNEFKSVKSADGAMSFHMSNGITGQTIDIVEDRHLNNLFKYFYYYDYKARIRVKFIIIDMYSPYISLIKKMFPNAKIIINKFHLTQLISRSLNKTRIKQTYLIYQEMLYSFKKKDFNHLRRTLNSINPNVSSYMKTSIKTLIKFLPYIKNTFENSYHNGFIEGNNNFIKIIKRITFGFRFFRRFKTRIMICKGLLKIKKIVNA